MKNKSSTSAYVFALAWLATACLGPTTQTTMLSGEQQADQQALAAGDLVQAPLGAAAISPEAARAWPDALANAFDITETFDRLQPWRGQCNGNSYGRASTPKHIDGSDSIWTYYSCYGGSTSGPAWIADFGAGTQVTGKSLIIDIGSTAKGPSRLGLYFGNGAFDSGYDDLYLFYRVKLPVNEWPTYIDPTTKVGSFSSGAPYTYWHSWKFGAFNMGCTGMQANVDCNGAEPYSEMHIVPHIKRYGYGTMAGKLAIVAEPTGLTPYWALGKEIQKERWLGVEFHYRLALQGTQNVVVMETWLYDEDGTAYQAQAPVAHPFTPPRQGEKFNFFFLGGNNSSSYTWGPTMESAYHVDDFIIHGSRIGPTYFQLANQVLSAGSVPDAIPPSVTSFSMPSVGSSNFGVPVRVAATDNVGVTGYLLTRSSTPPAAGATGWSASPPTSISFPDFGTYTVFAWAKDAAGNVSSGVSATINLPDPAPVVTSFSLPSTASSLSVPVLAFTATDNRPLAGYRITESATPPLASSAGWLASPPTSFTFSGTGVRTAYAWARDSVGRVSASRSATVTISQSDLIAPNVTAFSMPSASSSLTVPVTLFTATDNVRVTGFRITQSATAPLASATGWLTAAPTSFTFSGAGVRTAYAWARDAAGRVSASRSAVVTITIPVADTIAPVVTAFSMPSTATSLTVPVTLFTATDNVRVTGFRITESATAPLASATGWLATAPTSFRFAAAGARRAYAWARDAAGRVSASRSAAVTITIATSTVPSPSSREAMLKSRFDIVDTFDNIADWSQPQLRGNVYGSQYAPKRSDGSSSQWTYFSNWNTGGTTPWISNFGPGTSVTGKSLIIDMGGTKGPSRLGMYFGNGSASSGYSDIYVFYRVKFPRNQWPTSINSTTHVGTYTDGQPWTYWFSWKANTINMGCTGVNARDQCNGAEPYADYHIVPHIKTIGNTPRRIQYVMEPTGVGGGAASAIWTSGYEVARETWSGVEFHYRNYVSGTQLKTDMDVWLYDANGTAHQVLAGATFDYTHLQHSATDRWNFFFLGGNNSNSYLWGPTMQSAYYVDDFIIDGSRIGPAYFSLVGGN